MSICKTSDYVMRGPIGCEVCGKKVDKWIEIVPGGDLCINCAQSTMRVLFQDIIEYHNGKAVSLLDIMFHGAKDVNRKRLPKGIAPNGKPDPNFCDRVVEMQLFEQ
ncbi:hypothetical protein [Methanolobus sp.]|uniref:hypothetical protein n=1 Tax=Methanolobus sp. TaxID=1874737 RepID=UPI0025EA6E97|nr:hypothetical protein [Methanolobus sp.]